MIETLLIDFDDTICPSSHYYFVPQLDCAKIICTDLGYPCPSPTTIIEQQDQIRKQMMSEEGPKSIAVFSQSWILYYQGLCEQLGREPNINVISALGVTSAMWFRETYTLYPGVVETLENIKQRKIIVTLGNVDAQMYKIHNSGANKYVDEIEVVGVKNKGMYEALLAKYNLDPATTAMVGDNENTDIQPCIDAGIQTFHIHHQFETFKIDQTQALYQAIGSFNEITAYL